MTEETNNLWYEVGNKCLEHAKFRTSENRYYSYRKHNRMISYSALSG